MVFQRGMLAHFAARLRARQGGAEEVGAEVVLAEDGEAIVMDDNCTVSLVLAAGDESIDANRRVDNVTRPMNAILRYQ